MKFVHKFFKIKSLIKCSRHTRRSTRDCYLNRSTRDCYLNYQVQSPHPQINSRLLLELGARSPFAFLNDLESDKRCGVLWHRIFRLYLFVEESFPLVSHDLPNGHARTRRRVRLLWRGASHASCPLSSLGPRCVKLLNRL